MKLKYKKMILLTTMSTMGIGMLTLSISHDQPKAQESTRLEAVPALMSNIEDDGEQQEEAFMAQAEPTIAPTATPTPSPSPTPTPLPVYDFEENEKIDELLVEYYNAKAGRDLSKMRSLTTDPSEVDTIESLERKVKYIEEYKNIKGYAKKSYEPGAYIVYAYYEIKFARINTLAPALSKFYVVTNDEGKLRLHSGEMNPELKAYFDARNGDADVQELIRKTDEAGDKAREKDEDLMLFWNGLDELTQGAGENSDAQAQGDAADE
jgi:hypothetical protein